MTNAFFDFAWGVLFLFAIVVGIGIHKAIRIWLDNKDFDRQVRHIHEQGAHYLSQDLQRLTPEQFYKNYRGKLK